LVVKKPIDTSEVGVLELLFKGTCLHFKLTEIPLEVPASVKKSSGLMGAIIFGQVIKLVSPEGTRWIVAKIIEMGGLVNLQ